MTSQDTGLTNDEAVGLLRSNTEKVFSVGEALRPTCILTTPLWEHKMVDHK